MAFVLGWPKKYQFIGIAKFVAILAHFLAVPDWRNGHLNTYGIGIRPLEICLLLQHGDRL